MSLGSLINKPATLMIFYIGTMICEFSYMVIVDPFISQKQNNVIKLNLFLTFIMSLLTIPFFPDLEVTEHSKGWLGWFFIPLLLIFLAINLGYNIFFLVKVIPVSFKDV